MGDRYILTIKCDGCGFVDDDVYFAPTCGFTEWQCPQCPTKINLYKYTGISYGNASNASIIEEMVNKPIQ